MFLAVWRRPGGTRSRRLESSLAAMLAKHGGVRADSPSAVLAAWAPACLDADGQITTARAVSWGVRGGPQGHPVGRLEGDVLTLEAGPLPQYPLYYTRFSSDDYLLGSSRLEPLAPVLWDLP